MQEHKTVPAPRECALNAHVLKRFENFAQTVASHDGTSAFSEQTLVALRQAGAADNDSARLFAYHNNQNTMLAAWAVISADDSSPGLLEGAVLPEARGRGLASITLDALIKVLTVEQPLARYTVWVHQVLGGQQATISAAAQHLTAKYGFEPVRELHKMAVSLTAESRARIRQAAAASRYPQGIQLRTFKKGNDDLAWLTLNAAAFASHPEQGKLKQADLDERVNSSWFDAQGFFIADAPNGLAGYHWTKIPLVTEGTAEGEVYAVGVSPAWQGKKLGKALTLAGMDYLTRASAHSGGKLERIVLYVDADNLPAMKLYESLGFTDLSVDRMYTHP